LRITGPSPCLADADARVGKPSRLDREEGLLVCAHVARPIDSASLEGGGHDRRQEQHNSEDAHRNQMPPRYRLATRVD